MISFAFLAPTLSTFRNRLFPSMAVSETPRFKASKLEPLQNDLNNPYSSCTLIEDGINSGNELCTLAIRSKIFPSKSYKDALLPDSSTNKNSLSTLLLSLHSRARLIHGPICNPEFDLAVTTTR